MLQKNVKELNSIYPKQYRYYFYKYLLFEDVIKYFHRITHLSRVTRISRHSIYKAKERGWFDDYHARRIEYCSRGNLKAIYYDTELEDKKRIERQHKSNKAKFQHRIERENRLWKDHARWGDMTQREINMLILGR